MNDIAREIAAHVRANWDMLTGCNEHDLTDLTHLIRTAPSFAGAVEDRARIEWYTQNCERSFQLSTDGERWYCYFPASDDEREYEGIGQNAADAFRSAIDAARAEEQPKG